MGHTNYSIGHEAERYAAEFLQKLGYSVVALNWKTRFCEIDIIAKKDTVMYFVEVKFRKNNQQGRGLDYITAPKLKQMHYAAEMWVEEAEWTGEYELAAIEMTGENFTVINFIEAIS